ncbi:MAG: hypothetical protein AAGJ35_10435 [Myxococcota bacterium]
MKLNLNFAPVALILVLLFAACANEDADENAIQERIYTAYEMTYDENEDITRVTATFAFGNIGGTRLKLSDGAEIKFNGADLSFDNTRGLYRLEVPGAVEKGTFFYLDLNGKSYTNSILMDPVQAPTGLNTSIDRAAPWVVKWAGNPVTTTNGSVVATLVPEDITQTLIVTAGAQEADSVAFTAENLTEITPQQGSLTLERINTGTLSQATAAGGTIGSRYLSKSLDVVLN